MVLQLLSTTVKKPAKRMLPVILEGREATSNDRFTEAIRIRRRSGIVKGCPKLPRNPTVCYCTKYEGTAQRAVDRESQRVAPRFAIDALQSIGTAGHGHINFRGTYRFPIDRYAARLLPPAA